MLSDEDVRALSKTAKTLKLSRSEIVRRALKLFQLEQETKRLEAQMLRAYRKAPQSKKETAAWQEVGAWPED